MNKLKLITLSLVTATAIGFSGCGSSSDNKTTTPDTTTPDTTTPTEVSNVLPNTITENMTLTADKVWEFSGKVNVKAPAVLTIQPGTTIAGATPKSYIVVEPGAKLNAVGTQAKPIVFTSKKDVDGKSKMNAAGEWGGLVLAGHAYTHYKDNKYEADESVSFGSTTHDHDGDSSGDLEYVLIKHSGYEVEKDKELNGLSLAGVGSGTTLKNIAIIGGLDDGIEIWGGTANITGLYIYNAHDDSVDTDLGYRGTITNVLVRQVDVDKSNNHDSSGMEFGNDHNTIVTDDSNATQPTIINYTGYIKGGGFYNKFDAGFKWNNVKFISAKTADEQQVHFRGTDSYAKNKHLDGDVCFKDTALTLTEDNTFSKKNSKAPKTEKTAFEFFVTNKATTLLGGGAMHIDDDTSCAGVDEANVWKGKAGSNDPLEVPVVETNTLANTINTDTTLTADKVWEFSGKVNVKSGATLTIPAGTILAGATPQSYIVVEPGAKIIANGTKEKPIVFTSKKDVDGNSKDNAAGEWGGLVLAGNAYTHYSDNKYEADESVHFGSTTHDHDTESSGSLKYVVIKHTGYEVEKDKELNGLSLAGVGSGTTLENIAIIGGLDDGIEIWGGTANITGLYIYNAHDDSVDTDLGYRGTITNVLVRQVDVDKSNNHDSSGMEFGNDHNTIVTDDSNATQPTIINYTGYIKGGGFYNKFDAGFKWDNVKFISEKTVDQELIHFRGTDSYDTGAKHILSNVAFIDTKVTLDKENTFSKKNSKAPKTEKTAYDYFVTNVGTSGLPTADAAYIKYGDTTVTGADEANIWKGKAGTNAPLEDYTK